MPCWQLRSLRCALHGKDCHGCQPPASVMEGSIMAMAGSSSVHSNRVSAPVQVLASKVLVSATRLHFGMVEHSSLHDLGRCEVVSAVDDIHL